MASERWDDGKIAIVGAMGCNGQFSEPEISWFENIEELNCSGFDFVLDASRTGQVTMIVDNEKILIHDADANTLSHLKSLISLLLDMKILDADFADIKQILDKECTFKSFCTSESDVKDNIEPWVRENLADYSNSLFVHFQGNELSLVDMSDLVGKIANSIEIMEDNIVFSISGEEYKDAGIKISFWYR